MTFDPPLGEREAGEIKAGGGHGKEKERERGSALEREWGAGTETDLQVGGDVSPRMRREKEESAGKR